MTKRFLSLVVLVFTLVFAAPTVLAQLSLDETFVADSGSFQFSHPSDWVAEFDPSTSTVSVTGELDGSTIFMIVADPDSFATLTSGSDIEEAAETITTDASLERFFRSAVEFAQLPGTGRDVALAEVNSNDLQGIAFIVPIADSYGTMFIFATDGLDVITDNGTFFLEMVDSYDEISEESAGGDGLGGLLGSQDDDGKEEGDSGGLGGLIGSNNSGEGEVVTSLDNVDGDYRDAVAELQEVGLIGSGGSLVFNENSAFFDSEGNFFQPLASRAPRTDIVMSATLEFTVGNTNEFESCTLLARIEDSGTNTINTYLEVGISNEGSVYYFDARADDDGDFNFVETNLDLDDPHHLLFIAVDDTLSIYIDGELILADQPIEERRGTYGLALTGRGSNARCEGSNIWVYDAPVFEEGVCEVTSSGPVNLRSGPGTNFDRAGTLGTGESLQVVGQTAGSDGYTWYELDNDAWVREDIISLQGDCGSIPESE